MVSMHRVASHGTWGECQYVWTHLGIVAGIGFRYGDKKKYRRLERGHTGTKVCMRMVFFCEKKYQSSRTHIYTHTHIRTRMRTRSTARTIYCTRKTSDRWRWMVALGTVFIGELASWAFALHSVSSWHGPVLQLVHAQTAMLAMLVPAVHVRGIVRHAMITTWCVVRDDDSLSAAALLRNATALLACARRTKAGRPLRHVNVVLLVMHSIFILVLHVRSLVMAWRRHGSAWAIASRVGMMVWSVS